MYRLWVRMPETTVVALVPLVPSEVCLPILAKWLVVELQAPVKKVKPRQEDGSWKVMGSNLSGAI